MMDGGRDLLFLRIGFDLIHSRHGRRKAKDERSDFPFSTWLLHGHGGGVAALGAGPGWAGWMEGSASPASASPASAWPLHHLPRGTKESLPPPQHPGGFLSPQLQEELTLAAPGHAHSGHQAGGCPAPEFAFLLMQSAQTLIYLYLWFPPNAAHSCCSSTSFPPPSARSCSVWV